MLTFNVNRCVIYIKMEYQKIANNIIQSESFKSKIKITGKTPANGNTKDVEILVPLKYLSNFWRTLDATNKLRGRT